MAPTSATRSSWRHRPGEFVDLPNLQAIFSLGAGVDHVLEDPRLPEAPVVRVIDPDLTARISEWVALQVLLHHRQFRRYDLQQQQRIWAEDETQPAARDVRVGLLGLGELGLRCGAKIEALGFDVAGWTLSREKNGAGLSRLSWADGLDALLARTDILVCLLPLTPDTRGMLNAKLFAKLARDGGLGGPFLINAGRGGLQVEEDIVAALEYGLLKGASLDVFEREPLPKSSPLWRSPTSSSARTTPRSPSRRRSRATSPSKLSASSVASRCAMWWIGRGGIEDSHRITVTTKIATRAFL